MDWTIYKERSGRGWYARIWLLTTWEEVHQTPNFQTQKEAELAAKRWIGR